MELWRTVTDSSGRTAPLLMVRRLVGAGELDATVAFYEHLTGERCSLRFSYDEVGLALASVANVLIVAGDDAALAPFRATDFTVLVSSLDAYTQRLLALGAEVVEPAKAVPTGRNMLVRHPDGSLVEYVEHRPQPGEHTGARQVLGGT